MKELCKIYGYKPASSSEILASLEAKGLLKKVEDSKDRRKKELNLSERGIRTYESLVERLDNTYKINPIDNDIPFLLFLI